SVVDLHRRVSGENEPSQTDDSNTQGFDRLSVPLKPRNHSAVDETHDCRERWQQSITELLFQVVYLGTEALLLPGSRVGLTGKLAMSVRRLFGDHRHNFLLRSGTQSSARQLIQTLSR